MLAVFPQFPSVLKDLIGACGQFFLLEIMTLQQFVTKFWDIALVEVRFLCFCLPSFFSCFISFLFLLSFSSFGG